MSGSEEVGACKASGDQYVMRYMSQDPRLIGPPGFGELYAVDVLSGVYFGVLGH